jgi:hypothetical protein
LFIDSVRGYEAERAPTECRKSGQGWPRQQAQVSPRRNRLDADDEVGESSRSDHNFKGLSH